MFRLFALFLSLSLISLLINGSHSIDLTQYVNLFIGTQGTAPGTAYNGGNVFPGPALPFGAVKFGMDTTEFNSSTDADAGYTPDGNVTGFSLLHESGTGGAPKYGIISQMPLTNMNGINVMDNLTYMQPRATNDTAFVGYFGTSLANGVSVQLTATQHAGLASYDFPLQSDQYVLIDLSHYLPTQDENSGEQFYSNAHIELNTHGCSYSGWATYRGGWNEGPDYTVYFCAAFNKVPLTTQLWRGPKTDPYWPNSTNTKATFVTNETSLTGGTLGYNYADRVGAVFHFLPGVTRLYSKIGVSWIGVDNARQFLQDEIPAYDVNATVNASRAAWNNKVLSAVQFGGNTNTTNQTRLEMFYSALYRSHLLPSNRTGENPNWNTTEPSYDDLYTAWDIFRCLNSLFLLISPNVEEDIVRSLIDIWRHEGFMPDGRSSNYNGRVQGGSNADNILADAYVKNLRGGINWTDGYTALLTDAETVPSNNFDPEDLSQSTKEGRGALPDWLSLGYVSLNYGRSLSKTFEYSLNDFSLSQVVRGEGRPADLEKYLNRSAGWQRIWRLDVQSLNFTGFPAPFYANGSVLEDYDPLSCGECEWSSIAYEALPWEYSWGAPHDMASLILLMGGPNVAEARLDTMFVPGLKPGTVGSGGNNGIGNTLFNPGNEPSFLTPFLYNYLQGRQWKSVMRSREIVDQYYNAGVSGLPGNSDAGALDAWLVWNMLGLYPVVTQPVYLLLAPWFDDITVNLGRPGKDLRISAMGLREGSYFVQSVRVNDRAWNQSWVNHEDLVGGTNGTGGCLEFVMGSAPVDWDVGPLPPSPGHLAI